MYAYADGIFFQDDLYLSDNEDFSPAAKEVFLGKFGKELTVETLKDESIRKQWTDVKVQVMQDLTLKLMKAFRTYRPYSFFARGIYPEAILDKAAQERYGQNYRNYLDTYDYTIVMTNPLNDKQSENFPAWLGNLAQAAFAEPDAGEKVVFMINTFDFRENSWIKDKELKEQVDALRRKGAVNFTYYPEMTLEDKTTT